MKRLGVIGIVVKGDRAVSVNLQELLHDYSDIIVGRMGVPLKAEGVSAISVVVLGSNEEISALSGKLGRLDNVNIKSALLASDILD
ncbi:MAG TPA: CopG family transcriptional regulator [Eubacteriales bacterium]|nr:CopG family transcriptional regulator [Eubacteriales bacterium]HRU84695.1 CopG family transcriptional regulator [Eubacteriales bacterium]